MCARAPCGSGRIGAAGSSRDARSSGGAVFAAAEGGGGVSLGCVRFEDELGQIPILENVGDGCARAVVCVCVREWGGLVCLVEASFSGGRGGGEERGEELSPLLPPPPSPSLSLPIKLEHKRAAPLLQVARALLETITYASAHHKHTHTHASARARERKRTPPHPSSFPQPKEPKRCAATTPRTRRPRRTSSGSSRRSRTPLRR